MLIISGAYGRDYKGKAAVLADWQAGKDFRLRGSTDGAPVGGSYINRADVENVSPARSSLQVRYKADRSVCILSPVWTGNTLTGWRVR